MQNRHYPLKVSTYLSGKAGVTLLFLLLLLTVLFVFGYTPSNDGEGYLDYARTCISQHQLYPCTELINGRPFIWNPGTINLVALSLALFNSVTPLLILMCLMKALTAFFIAQTAQLLFNRRVALATIVLYAFYPNNWGQSTIIQSEIPMLFFTFLAVWIIVHFMVKSRKKKSFTPLFIAGLLLAVANWFRPVALIFLLTFLLLFVLYRRHALRNVIALLLGYLLTTAAIGTSCYLRTGYFVYQSDTLWFNMVEATYETSTSPHYNSEMFPKGTPRYIENMEQKTAIECSQIWRQRSLQWLSEHPLQYLAKVPSRLFHMYKNDIDNLPAFLPEKSDPARNYVTLPLASLKTQFLHLTATQYLALTTTIFYFLLLLCGLFGAMLLVFRAALSQPLSRYYSSKRRRKSLSDHTLASRQTAFLVLFLVIGGSLATVLAVHGETRFKAPYMPFLFMLAAYAITEISQAYFKKS